MSTRFKQCESIIAWHGEHGILCTDRARYSFRMRCMCGHEDYTAQCATHSFKIMFLPFGSDRGPTCAQCIAEKDTTCPLIVLDRKEIF